jgi:hypothetical protein
MRRGRRQEVTGVVVNDKPSVPRKALKKFRAVLFQIERDGPQGKSWGHGEDLFASLQGFASYVAMVDPAKGRPLLERVRALAATHGHVAKRIEYPKGPRRWESKPEPAPAPAPATEPSSSPSPAADGDAAATETGDPEQSAKKKWWQFWK